MWRFLTSAKSAWAREPASETSTSVRGLALGCELCFLTKQLSKLFFGAQPGCCWRQIDPTAKLQQGPWAVLPSLQFGFAQEYKQGGRCKG